MDNQSVIAQRKTILREIKDMPDGKAKEAKRDEADALLRKLKNVTSEDVYGFTVA